MAYLCGSRDEVDRLMGHCSGSDLHCISPTLRPEGVPGVPVRGVRAALLYHLNQECIQALIDLAA